MSKITLNDYYKNLVVKNPKTEFRELIMKECGISRATFFLWVHGKVKIPLNAKQKISEITNIPLIDLFPNN